MSIHIYMPNPCRVPPLGANKQEAINAHAAATGRAAGARGAPPRPVTPKRRVRAQVAGAAASPPGAIVTPTSKRHKLLGHKVCEPKE
jgi:hypothetical protein